MIKDISVLKNNNPENPFFLFRPHILKRDVSFFLKNFPGKVLYAVKANPSEIVIKSIKKAGVKSFDTASLNEIKKIRGIFKNAEIFFMNPVKSKNSIAEAYFKYSVKHFSLDDEAELNKILMVTNGAKDLCLHLRLSIPNNFAKIKISNKFGASKKKATELLKIMKKFSSKIGISFHPGSQCMNPEAYKIAMKISSDVIEKSGVDINFLNVGGGFPVKSPGLNSLPLINYFRVIKNELNKIKTRNKIKLLSEPGRALVSECMSLIVRVELRKGCKLYINDGIYGSLRDLSNQKINHTVRLRNRKIKKKKKIAFNFYGPTCDSNDFIKGPFYLPDEISSGDLIEIFQMGSYSFTMKSDFNGYFYKPKFFTEK